MTLTVGSLFSGIGGLDLGLERAGMTVRWQSEIDPYASRVLAKHWPTVPNLGDVTQIEWSDVEPVDLICGGFPCQDISVLGKRAGLSGERSGLWANYAEAVRVLRPRHVLVENVPSLLVRGFDRVAADLAGMGYGFEWAVIPASAIGAPHLRARIWILAYPGGKRDRLPQDSVFAGWCSPQHSDWWASEPGVCRVADGIPAQVDRLRALGNSVVPQIPEWIGRQLLSSLVEAE